MNNAIYTFTVPVFVKSLGGLRTILNKAKEHLAAQGQSEQDFLAKRLAPDMFPLIKQIQIACDNAKGSTARLAGVEVPKHEDNEQTIDDLLARIDKTVAFVQAVPEHSFETAADRQVTLPYFPGKYFTGFDFAREYAIPNFFFHVTVAYALIRHQDVEIGKGDFINGLTLKDLAS